MNLHTVLAEGNGNGTSIFNSVEHDGNTIQSFTGFVEAWEMWNDMVSIDDLRDDASEEQRK